MFKRLGSQADLARREWLSRDNGLQLDLGSKVSINESVLYRRHARHTVLVLQRSVTAMHAEQAYATIPTGALPASHASRMPTVTCVALHSIGCALQTSTLYFSQHRPVCFALASCTSRLTEPVRVPSWPARSANTQRSASISF